MGKGYGQSLGFRLQPARFAGEHEAKQSSHLLAELRIAARLGGLALERRKLLLDFHKDVVDAGEIELGRLELGLGKALLGFIFRDSGGLFDDGPAVGWLRTQNLPDASLLDDRVGVRAQADAHK